MFNAHVRLPLEKGVSLCHFDMKHHRISLIHAPRAHLKGTSIAVLTSSLILNSICHFSAQANAINCRAFMIFRPKANSRLESSALGQTDAKTRWPAEGSSGLVSMVYLGAAVK